MNDLSGEKRVRKGKRNRTNKKKKKERPGEMRFLSFLAGSPYALLFEIDGI